MTGNRKPVRISVSIGSARIGNAKAGKKRKRSTAESSAPHDKSRRRSVGTTSSASSSSSSSSLAAGGTSLVPALFRSRPTGRSGRSSVEDKDVPGTRGEAGEEETDEFGSLDALAAAAGNGGDIDSDALLAFRSLVQRGAAALCPPPPLPLLPQSSTLAPVPFVLRPMLQASLLSTVTAAAAAEAASEASMSLFGGRPVSYDGATTAAEAEARAEEANRASSAEASTGLEIELGRLRRSNRVRMLQLQGTDDAEADVAVVETSEYIRGCREAVESNLGTVCASPLFSEISNDEKRAILDVFLGGLCEWVRSSVSEAEMAEKLRTVQLRSKSKSGNVKASARPPTTTTMTTTTLTPTLPPVPAVGIRTFVDYLVSVGVLLPRRDDGGGVGSHFDPSSLSSISSSSLYWFSLPGLGLASRLISKGRARVLTKLRSARYKEMKRSVLEMGVVEVEEGRKRGAGVVNGMPAAFVVRDLISRGAVRVKETPSGQFLKLLQP